MRPTRSVTPDLQASRTRPPILDSFGITTWEQDHFIATGSYERNWMYFDLRVN